MAPRIPIKKPPDIDPSDDEVIEIRLTRGDYKRLRQILEEHKRRQVLKSVGQAVLISFGLLGAAIVGAREAITYALNFLRGDPGPGP
jgi:hypothetical protein